MPPVVNSNSGDWVHFEGATFSESPKQQRRKNRREKSRNRRSPDVIEHRDDDSKSWMNKPVSDSASWMPVAPPKASATAAPPPEQYRQPKTSSSRRSGSKSDSRHRRTAAVESSSSTAPKDKVPISPESSNRVARRGSTGTSEIIHSAPSMTSTSESSRSTEMKSSSRHQRRSSNRAPPLSPTLSSSRKQRNTSAVTAESSRPSSDSRRDPPPSAHSHGPRAEPRGRAALPPSSPQEGGRRSRSRSTTRSAPSRENQQQQPKRNRSRSKPPMTTTGRGRAEQTDRRASRERSSSRPRNVTAARQPLTPTSVASTGNGLPPRHARRMCDDGSARTNDCNLVGRDISYGTTGTDSASDNERPTLERRASTRKKGGLMEKLFGDHVGEDSRRSTRNLNASGNVSGSGSGSGSNTSSTTATNPRIENIHPRILLSATVYHNSATNLWITTINTNQKGVAKNPAKASKHLKAFSFSSEREARESAIANAPPKMLPFDESPHCFVCSGKFAVFRRASHCRNCGVCICSNCTVTWPSKMIPETYNLKNEKNVNICVSCDQLSIGFKRALLKGDYEDAIALYGTGNINLRTPFNVPKIHKAEIMYPIHCAVEGGNLLLVRWLIEEHFCPVKKVTSGNGKKKRGVDIPILTSKGRSALGIAMTHLKVDILRYLVIDRSVSVYEVKDLAVSLHALEAVLLALPQTSAAILHGEITVPRWATEEYYDDGSEVSDSFRDCSTLQGENSTIASRRTEDQGNDVCIICYDKHIDCVITPCGHQICCLECSENLNTCPVCNTKCKFIRIFKP